MSESEFDKRLAAVRDLMADRDLSSLLVWGEPHGTFGLLGATNDIGYLTNWPIRHPGTGPALLVVPSEREVTLLVSGPLSATRNAEELSDVEDVRRVTQDEFATEAAAVLSTDDPDSQIGVVRHDDIPFWLYDSLTDKLQAARLVDATEVLSVPRTTKTPAQVDRLRDAAETADRMFETLSDNVTAGTQRSAVLADMEDTAKRAGTEFATTWLAAGPLGGEHPYFEPARTRGDFEEGELFTVGLQVILNNYWGHSIRMGTVGDPSDKQRRLFSIVREAQRAVLDIAEPGVELSTLAASIQAVYDQHGYENSFRSLHGLGLRYGGPPDFPQPDEEFDPATATEELVPGMVFELHPNIWGGTDDDCFAALGDMFSVTEDGVQRLTEFPRDMMVK